MQVVLIIRGFHQEVSTVQLLRKLECYYQNLFEFRHKFMVCGFSTLDRSALPDRVTETDELFQNADQKGEKHRDPNEPPR